MGGEVKKKNIMGLVRQKERDRQTEREKEREREGTNELRNELTNKKCIDPNVYKSTTCHCINTQKQI